MKSVGYIKKKKKKKTLEPVSPYHLSTCSGCMQLSKLWHSVGFTFHGHIKWDLSQYHALILIYLSYFILIPFADVVCSFFFLPFFFFGPSFRGIFVFFFVFHFLHFIKIFTLIYLELCKVVSSGFISLKQSIFLDSHNFLFVHLCFFPFFYIKWWLVYVDFILPKIWFWFGNYIVFLFPNVLISGSIFMNLFLKLLFLFVLIHCSLFLTFWV